MYGIENLTELFPKIFVSHETATYCEGKKALTRSPGLPIKHILSEIFI